ncbi:amidinotransferase [Halobacteriales archaeon SW_7_68_16]|nr:MAG: amidinotransferase [Halobacteriales archaeon SW_7_68_16]
MATVRKAPRRTGSVAADEIDLASVATRPTHDRVVMVSPAYARDTGLAPAQDGGEIDRERMYRQWAEVRTTLAGLARVDTLDPVRTWEGIAGIDGGSPPDARTSTVAPPWRLPDMVFCANHGLPYPDERAVLRSEMATDLRADEPAYLGAWCERAGYDVRTLDTDGHFEGMGDALWHPDRRLLWGAVGPRTDAAVYDEIATRMETDVIVLDTPDERYFHLDTRLVPIDVETALVVPGAFTDADLAAIEAVFERTIRVPADEADPGGGYACNAHVVGDDVVMQAGNPETAAALADAGYCVHPVETGELIRCGGSVFCATLSLPD